MYAGEESKKQYRSAEDDRKKGQAQAETRADQAKQLSEGTAQQQQARARQRLTGPTKPIGSILGGTLASASPVASGAIIPASGKTLLGT